MGEAGIGKTRLLQEAARRSGMRTLDLYGLPERLSTEDLLEAWCVPLLSRARHGIEGADLSIAAAAYPRLADLDPVAGADPPPKVTPARALAAVARLITHAAERDPLLFLIDDLPRMRSEVRAFVAEMAAVLAHARLAFLITARQDPAASGASDPLHDRALAPVLERHLVRRIDVQPLAEGGLRELIAAELDLGIVPALLPWLAAKTGGNPLFAIELLRALEGQGLLYMDHRTGSWLLGGQLTEVGLPETITHVLDSRRRRLPPELAHPLPALALLGPDAPTAFLARVLALDSDAVGDLRRRLTRAGVLIRRGETHAFSHPLMAENWVRDLDPKDRRRLLVEAIDLDLEAIFGRQDGISESKGVIRGGGRRGSCATGLEPALDDELARIIAYAGALDRDHDASYPLAALELGRRSLVGQGPRAAVHWARRAARRVTRVRSRGQRRWLRGQIDLLMGNALYQKGRLPAAEARLRHFLRTPEVRDLKRGIGAFTALGQLLIKRSQPDEARRVLEAGRATLTGAAAEPGALMASAEILCYLARIEMSRDDLHLAADLLQQASATLADLHDDPQVAEARERILVEQALLSMRRGDLRKGIQGFEELLALGRHRPRDNTSRLANLALYLALVGDLRRARPLALEALRAGSRTHDANAASFRWICLGLIEAIAGNWRLAVDAHQRARQLGRGGDPGTWHLSTGELARVAQVLEGSEASDRLWHEAMAGSPVAGRPSRGHLFHLYWSRAWALLRRRDWKGALAASSQAAALVGANPRNHAVVELTALEAEVRLELETTHEAGGTGPTRAENLARLASRLDSVEPYLREQLVRQELVNLARVRLYLTLAGWRGARPEALIAEIESQLVEMNAPALMAEVAKEFSGTAVAALPRFQRAFEGEQRKQPAAEAAVEAASVELLSSDGPQHLPRILALGRLKVFRSGEIEPLTRSDWGSKKARILLAYLLAEDLEGKGVARDALLEAAWADDDSLTIEHTFRVTMTLLRKALGSARSGAGGRLLLFADGVYRIDFSAVWCDCRAFEQGLRDAAACERNREPKQALELRRQAFDLYQGEFLADFDELWIEPRRERYRRRFLEVGVHLTEEALRVGDLGEAQEVAERLVSCDSLSEPAHHLLVRAYEAAGRHDAAARQRERCRALQKRLGAGDARVVSPGLKSVAGHT